MRVDSHLMAPYAVPPYYDSLLAKVIVHGHDRARRSPGCAGPSPRRVVEGVKTTIPFHLKVLSDPAFLEGRVTSADEPRPPRHPGSMDPRRST